jgi:rhodanese-related sulfurtransferase
VNRRAFLAGTATAASAGLAGCAGLLGSSSGPDTDTDDASALTLTPGPTQGDSLPADETHADGYPPDFDERPPEQTVGEGHFEPYDVSGSSVMNADSTVTVTLASIDAAYYWYARGDARFVDARPHASYEASHVFGAVSSPYNTAIEGTTVADWPTDDRVVCYCVCPHHQSSIRAAELQRYGFENVYVIDEGFRPWLQDRNYPVAGSRVDSLPEPWTIAGETAPADAGDTAWARHADSDQTEATKIAPDGSYEMALRFRDVTAADVVTVSTPSYEVSGPLGDLAAEVVTPP